MSSQKLSVKTPTGVVSKMGGTVAAAAVLLFAGAGNAAIIAGDHLLIDFGKNDAGYTTSGNWNNVAIAANTNFTSSTSNAMPGASNLIRNSDGAATGTALFFTSGGVGIGGADNTNADANSGYPESAARDTMFNGDTSFFELRGLNPNLTYTLKFFGAVPSHNARPDTVFTVDTDHDGFDASDPSDSYNPTNVNHNGETAVKHALFQNVSPTSQGVISFQMGRSAATGASHLNVMEIVAVPEPTSLAAMALGAGMLLRRRRRQ